LTTKQPVAAIVPVADPAPAPPPPPFPTPIVELSGTGTQIGIEHGRELSAPIQILFE
jgi:hypothetical protein